MIYEDFLHFCLTNEPNNFADWDKGMHLVLFLQNWDRVDEYGFTYSDSVMIDILEYKINISKG